MRGCGLLLLLLHFVSPFAFFDSYELCVRLVDFSKGSCARKRGCGFKRGSSEGGRGIEFEKALWCNGLAW